MLLEAMPLGLVIPLFEPRALSGFVNPPAVERLGQFHPMSAAFAGIAMGSIGTNGTASTIVGNNSHFVSTSFSFSGFALSAIEPMCSYGNHKPFSPESNLFEIQLSPYRCGYYYSENGSTDHCLSRFLSARLLSIL
jgi:hypothetical protein